MAKVTYTPITTQVIPTDTTTVTLSNLSGYSELFIVGSIQGSSGSAVMGLRLNGDEGSNYSTTYMYNTSTTVPSGKESGLTAMSGGDIPASGNVWGVNLYHLINYSSSANYKNVLMRHNAGTGVVVESIGLWRNTSPVTSVTLFANIKAGSIITVYGIL